MKYSKLCAFGLVSIFLTIFTAGEPPKEHDTKVNPPRVAIAFLVTTPDEATLENAANIAEYTGYDVFMVIDDMEKKYEDTPLVRMLQEDHEKVESAGFVDMNQPYNGKSRTSSWDVATYVWQEGSQKDVHDLVWFIEADVLIPHPSVVSRASERALESEWDLSIGKLRSRKDEPNWYYWPRLPWFDNNCIPKEQHHVAMVCAMAMSKKMFRALAEVDAQCKGHDGSMNEALYPTVAVYKNLRIGESPELATIWWRQTERQFGSDSMNWPLSEIKKAPYQMFHPVKDLNSHKTIRESLNRDHVFDLPVTEASFKNWHVDSSV